MRSRYRIHEPEQKHFHLDHYGLAASLHLSRLRDILVKPLPNAGRISNFAVCLEL